MTTRIEELHAEIKYRDNRIEELEQELKVKDEIIRKQVIMLSEYQGKEDKRKAKRLKQANLRQPCTDIFIQAQCNNLLNLG